MRLSRLNMALIRVELPQLIITTRQRGTKKYNYLLFFLQLLVTEMKWCAWQRLWFCEDNVLVKLFDFDKGGKDELIAQRILSLKEIQTPSQGKNWATAQWLNFYRGVGMQKEATDYAGRVLTGISLTPAEPKVGCMVLIKSHTYYLVRSCHYPSRHWATRVKLHNRIRFVWSPRPPQVRQFSLRSSVYWSKQS